MGRLTGNEFLSWAENDARILVMGSHESGKTSIVEQMKSGSAVDTQVDQNGWTLNTRQYGKATFVSIDIGGRCSMRALYKNFLQSTDAVIYVLGERRNMIMVDRAELHNIFEDEALDGVPLLVVDNCPHIADLVNEKQLFMENFTERMGKYLKLDQLNGHDWHIVAASTVHPDEKLHEGLEWLDRAICTHKSRAVISKNVGKVTAKGEITMDTTYKGEVTLDTTDKCKVTLDTTDESEVTLDATDKCEVTVDTTDKCEVTLDTTDKCEVTVDTTDKCEVTLDTTDKCEVTVDTTDKCEVTVDTTDKCEVTLDTTDKCEVTVDTRDKCEVTLDSTDKCEVTVDTTNKSEVTVDTTDKCEVTTNTSILKHYMKNSLATIERIFLLNIGTE